MHTDMLIIPPAYGILSVCVCVGRASVASGWPIILMQGDAIIPTAQLEIVYVTICMPRKARLDRQGINSKCWGGWSEVKRLRRHG